jgi:hypothetical protein
MNVIVQKLDEIEIGGGILFDGENRKETQDGCWHMGIPRLQRYNNAPTKP